VPPLRSRREDIPALVECFMKQARERDPRVARLEISPETMAGLAAHDWPGNVRELRNVLDRAVYIAAASSDSKLRLLDLPVLSRGNGSTWHFEEGESYRETRARYEHEFEQRYVSWLLDKHGGNVSAAARSAKMDRKYLHDLARRHGLRERS
jgi:DNA-binding NtrC family response regulator